MKPETRSMIAAAVVGGVVSVLVSLVGMGITLYTDSVSQQKVAQLQTVLTFTDRDQPLAGLASKYIAAVSDGGDLSDLQTAIRGEVAQEINAVERLRPILGSQQKPIEDYQIALAKFADTLEHANSPTRMRGWAEAFGRTVDARHVLNATIRAQIGV